MSRCNGRLATQTISLGPVFRLLMPRANGRWATQAVAYLWSSMLLVSILLPDCLYGSRSI